MKNNLKKYNKYKYFYYVRSVFKNVTKNNFLKLKFTKDSYYSVSKIEGALFLYKVIKKTYKDTFDLILTDGTANIGSDTIFLSDYFKKINAIEYEEENYEALINNIKVLKKRNIKTYNKDSNKIITKLKQDIIYIDAPWGGPDYKTKKKVKLYLGEVEIIDFYLKHINAAKTFIFKVPKNYDFSKLHKLKNKSVKLYLFENKYVLIKI